MALTFETIHTELASILADLKERSGPDGQLWCSPRDAAALTRHITDRTEEFGTIFSGVARFAYLAARASPRGYFDFVYQPLLRANMFKSACIRARQKAMLSSAHFEVSELAVRFLEQPMMRAAASGLEPFDLTYAQMPRLAAFLDILHNSLGYAVVSEVVASLSDGRKAAGGAAAAAKELRSKFNAWLQPRLESTHRRTQAKTIHAFLASRHALLPEKIDDDVILSFWQERAADWRARMIKAHASYASEPERRAQSLHTLEKAASDEGFRLFRSAVRVLLRYRAALEAAIHERAEAEHKSFGDPSIPGEVDVEQIESVLLEPKPQWISPLAMLRLPPANRIKWLTLKETSFLANYLGSNLSAASSPELQQAETSGAEGEDDDAGAIGLMDGAAFDLRLLRTLLRADVFGAAQARIVAQLRKRQEARHAVAVSIADIDEPAYRACIDTYRKILAQVKLEALAALNILGHQGHPAALLLIEYLGGEVAKRAVLAIVPSDRLRLVKSEVPPREPDEDTYAFGGLFYADIGATDIDLQMVGDSISELFKSKDIEDRTLGGLVSSANSARAKVNREGFRKQDQPLPEIQAALCSSAPAAIALIETIERLDRQYEITAPSDQALIDREHFRRTFDVLYQPLSVDV
jgi:hypothetical protein